MVLLDIFSNFFTSLEPKIEQMESVHLISAT